MAREAIGSIFQDWIPGSDFLDLYAGTGSMGLEALSRGAKTVTFVEKNRAAIDILRANIQVMTRAKDCFVLAGTVVEQVHVLARREQHFNLIFIDPPYDVEGIPIRMVEPILAPEGTVIFQRPERAAVGDPFRETRLEEVDNRRYGKADVSFWKFPIDLTEKGAV
jgi:16S rRNA (guanine966-N2)-methyltransferase